MQKSYQATAPKTLQKMDNRATKDRTPAPNSTYPKGGVSCSKNSFVVNHPPAGGFQIKFCAESPALQLAAKRMVQAKDDRQLDNKPTENERQKANASQN
jgi:hypothetical protein